MVSFQDQDLLEQISHHPLFKGADAAISATLIAQCELFVFEPEELIFTSQRERESLFLILTGTVEVFVERGASGQAEVLEVLQRGDLIGLSSIAHFLEEPLALSSKYNVGVRCLETSQCLEIPFRVLRERWADTTVQNFVLSQLALRLKDVYSSLAEQVHYAKRWGDSEAFIRRVQELMSSPVLTILEDSSIREAAQKMKEFGVSSVVVLQNDNQLAGILTEGDLVRLFAQGKQIERSTVKEWMTEKPLTIRGEAYYYEALAIFLTKQIKHLPVLKDEQVVGILTLPDLMRKKNRGVLDSIHKIERAERAHLAQLKEAIYSVLDKLLRDGVPALHTLEVLTTLYDRLIQHCLRLALKELEDQGWGQPPVSFGWFQMGSAGRAEQFMLTDQDHFLVYEAGASSTEQQEINNYFTRLADEVVQYLQEAGFSTCVGQMMATNPEWRGSLIEWQHRLRHWVDRRTNEILLLACNFLSFRHVYGSEQLHSQFLQLVKKELYPASSFFYRMVQVELERTLVTADHPLRSFLRLPKKEINLKQELLFPFHHALQIIAIQHQIYEGTVVQKVKQLITKHEFSPLFGEELLEAYSTIIHVRMELSWQQYTQGQEIQTQVSLNELTTRHREKLSQALKTMRTLQKQMQMHYGM